MRIELIHQWVTPYQQNPFCLFRLSPCLHCLENKCLITVGIRNGKWYYYYVPCIACWEAGVAIRLEKIK